MMTHRMDVVGTVVARDESGAVLRSSEASALDVPCCKQPRSSAKAPAFLSASDIQWSHIVYWIPGTAKVAQDSFLRIKGVLYKVLAAAEADRPSWPNEALVEEARLPDGF